MSDDMVDLEAVFEGWQVRAMVPYVRSRSWGRTEGYEWVEIRASRYPMIEDGVKTNAEQRRDLFAYAEEALASLLDHEWKFVSVPNIELTGDLIHSLGKPSIIHHRCDLRVEVTR